MGTSDELNAEQAHIDRAYERIDELRVAARRRAADALADSSAGGQTATRIDRDALVWNSLARQAALQIGDQSLCFGRLDTVEGERFHIGRLSVSEIDGEPLIVDWRAPIAEAFYRATAREPAGIARRRHLRMSGRTVVALDDELLDRDNADEHDSDLVGEAALLAALTKTRTGRMGDIVATIQAAQDEAIRAPLKGVLVVQGGPGTGKTAVALHRAAYLLYAHRLPLASQGVIVVGPNPVFLRYVENVLPGLGETGVRLATPGQLVPGVAVTAVDTAADAAVKGDAAMADRLAAAIDAHRRPLEETASVPYGAWRLTLTPSESEALIATAATKPTYNAGRKALAGSLVDAFADKAQAALERAARTGHAGPELAQQGRERLVAQLRRTPEVAALLERLWPKLTAARVVDETLAAVGIEPRSARSEHDAALLDEAMTLLGPRPRRGRRRAEPPLAIDDALDRTLSEIGMLPSCPSCGGELTLREGRWECDVDACLRQWDSSEVMDEATRRTLDEMVERVTGTHRAPPADEARVETFGHAVVDEAQDLTPMQWRVLRRRVPSGSMTIVGDLGQAKYGWAPTSWRQVAALAAPEAAAHVLELDVNYRTPAEVMDLAAAVLTSIDRAVRPPRSVRRSGEPPVFVRVDSDPVERARAIAIDEARVVDGGRVAIVLPPSAATPAEPSVLDRTIAELGIEDAKGLEFDSVIVVEPAEFDAGSLYVALTRTTRRLTIVSTANDDRLASAPLSTGPVPRSARAPVDDCDGGPPTPIA